MNIASKQRYLAAFCVTGFLVCAALRAAPAAGEGASWPAFHGPDRLNVSSEKGLLRSWPEDGPPLAWKYPSCGRGYSGVSIAEGMIFTAGDFPDAERIFALDMDGKLLWETPNGKPWTGSCPGSRTTPTWDEGVLYHMSPIGRLAAFEARTGRQMWTVDLKEKFAARGGIWALAENVLIEGDKLFCMPGGPRGRVVALDKRTGNVIWNNSDIEHVAAYCSPVIVAHDGVRQLLSMTQKSVVSLDIASGKLLWSAPFVPRSPQNALTPMYHKGHVFVACGHSTGGTLMKIDQAAGTATPVWHREDLDNCHGGTLFIDGKIYGCGCRMGGKHVYCVDFFTGKTVKLDRSLGKVGMTAVDGMIYCMGHRGTVSLLKVTPMGFDIVSQFNLPRKPSNFYLAHPVICGGRLYLRGGPDLYVYDIRARTTSGK